MAVSIAIDGHAGAGKGTLATALAKELDYLYLDTGAMYRSCAVKCIRMGVKSDEEEKIREIIKEIDYKVKYSDGQQFNIVDGENVNPYIRTEEVGMMASSISAYPFVREKLVAMQREIAGNINVVIEGRDIGSVVLPNATHKFFLTASPEVRAERRIKQLNKSQDEYETVLADINKRDYQDSHREHSPLIQPEDATYIDSSNMTIEEVINFCLEKIKSTNN